MKKIFISLTLGASVLFSNSLADIQSSKTIRIGVSNNDIPFSEKKDGKFVGFEIELATAIANELMGGGGGKIEFVGLDSAERIPLLQDKKVDFVIANFTDTPERAKKVSFSIPYLSVTKSAVTPKNAGVTSLKDLYGKTVLTMPQSTGEAFVKSNSQLTNTSCLNTFDCYTKLKNGEADAFIDDNIVVATVPLIDANFEMSATMLGDLEFIAVATNKDEKELLSAINKAILSLSSSDFFTNAYKNELEPFYKGMIEKKYLLLDDVYRSFGIL